MLIIIYYKRCVAMIKNQMHWEKDAIKVKYPTCSDSVYKEEYALLENGSKYTGDVKDGCPHGKGREFIEDSSVYFGTFKKGKWHGVGILTSETLTTYEYEFIDGRCCGI